MDKIQLGVSSVACSRLAYGCWRITGTGDPNHLSSDAQANGRRAILAAYEAGYTLFDHADVYCQGAAEQIFGIVLKEVSGMRAQILISSKCGVRKKGEPGPESPYRYDFSTEHILRSCEQSLRRLGVDMIDLYQLHRPDWLGDPHEVAEAFVKLKDSGKVREFGVSNFRPSLVTAFQRACPMPLIVNQVEVSLEKLDCFTDGTLDQCLAEKITPMAWSPLAGGRLTELLPIDLHSPDHAKRIAVRETLDRIARERGTTRPIAALAWLLKHPSKIVPIVGTSKPEHIKALVRAVDFELSRDEWYELLEAARGERLP